MRRAAVRHGAGALAVGLAVALGRTGCVGIPTSGGVETGPVIVPWRPESRSTCDRQGGWGVAHGCGGVTKGG